MVAKGDDPRLTCERVKTDNVFVLVSEVLWLAKDCADYLSYRIHKLLLKPSLLDLVKVVHLLLIGNDHLADCLYSRIRQRLLKHGPLLFVEVGVFIRSVLILVWGLT